MLINEKAEAESSNFHDEGIKSVLSGNIQEAIILFKKAVAANPQNLNAIFNIADLLNSLNKHDEALVLFSRLCEINPKNGLNWYNKAITEYELNLIDQGNSSLIKAYDLNPDLQNLTCQSKKIPIIEV